MLSKTFALALMAAGAAAKIIPGEYIVQMAPTAAKDGAAMYRHLEEFNIGPDNLMHEYNINNGEFVGYAFKGDANTVLRLSESVDVLNVQANEEVYALQCNEVSTGSGLWGLSRTTNRNRVLNSASIDSNDGRGVSAYILDTGVRYSHNEFRGRTRVGRSFITGESAGTDGNGHGTHVAGTVAGTTYGLARAATVIDVKVLSASGSGSFAGVISGVDYVASDCRGNCVANMSLGGGASAAVDNAVIAAGNAGVTMVLASGNSNANACNSSPARAGGASSDRVITVNSSTNQDARSSFSNFGTCTDVFAPGSNVQSAWFRSDTDSNTISGTSMASPHVAGIAAAMYSRNPGLTAASLKSALLEASTTGVVSNVGSGSPNRLLHMTC